MTTEIADRVQEYRAVASASAPSFGLLEGDLSPIRFRAYVARRGEEHHLLVQGEADLPDDAILSVACLFASAKRPQEKYVLRGIPMPARGGQFAGLLLRFTGAPRPGLYTVRVTFSPLKQPSSLRAALADRDEWCTAAEIAVDPPAATAPIREKRLSWQVECLAAELARLEDQLEMASRLLEEARTDEQRETWRLEVLLLHDLAIIYGRRLSAAEEELRNAGTSRATA